MFTGHLNVGLGVMAPDLVNFVIKRDCDLKSDTSDYERDNVLNGVNRASEPRTKRYSTANDVKR